MQNKRWLILCAGVLVMVLSTAGFAISGIKGHFDRGHGKELVREKVLSHIDYTVQELGLTAEQQAKYAIIRAKMDASLEATLDKHTKIHESMKAEWDTPNPDVKEIAQRIKNEIETIPNQLNVKIDYLLEVYDILNEGQKKQLVEMLKEHIDDKKGCS